MKGLNLREHGIVSCSKGFTLIEILVVVLLLALAISPIVGAFSPAIFSTSGEEELAVVTNQARGTLYRVAALDFGVLSSNTGNPVNLASLFGSTAEAAKETFSFRGSSYTPTVSITDASGGTGGLLELGVSIEDRVTLKTLRADY